MLSEVGRVATDEFSPVFRSSGRLGAAPVKRKQWHYVDVALFSGMPPTEATLACVVEAKLLGRSVFAPTGQAANYALRAGRENCNRLIVTDGIRYALHRRSARVQVGGISQHLEHERLLPGIGLQGCGRSSFGHGTLTRA